MKPSCLSAAGPCQELCDKCIEAHKNWVERETAIETTRAIRWLESRGYVVRLKGVDIYD